MSSIPPCLHTAWPSQWHSKSGFAFAYSFSPKAVFHMTAVVQFLREKRRAEERKKHAQEASKYREKSLRGQKNVGTRTQPPSKRYCYIMNRPKHPAVAWPVHSLKPEGPLLHLYPDLFHISYHTSFCIPALCPQKAWQVQLQALSMVQLQDQKGLLVLASLTPHNRFTAEKRTLGQ